MATKAKQQAIQVSPEERRLLDLARILVVDLELTCGPGVNVDSQEIIEIGTCGLVLGKLVSESDSASIHVKPERSVINSFCTALTGVTRDLAANEPGFARRAPRIRDLLVTFGADAWCSWGPDHTLLHRQCVASGVENPLASVPHIDVRSMLTSLVYKLTGNKKPLGANSGVGLATALEELEIDFEGRQHCGRADAYNTARLLQQVRLQMTSRFAKS